MTRVATHPGEVLAEDLRSLGLSAEALERQLSIPPGRLAAIVAGERPVDADTALRLGHYFDTSAMFWLNLQVLHDLRRAEQAQGDAIARLPVLSLAGGAAIRSP